MNEAQTTIRNAGFLLIQRGLFILGSLLFAVLVPRLMGPYTYGRYALVTSLYLWLVMASDLGFSEVMGRFVPPLRLEEEGEKLRKFFNHLFAVGITTGALSAGIYLTITIGWLRDFDLSLMLIMTASLFIRAGARPFFPLFLGLNQAARWGMGEIVRHWSLLVWVILGFTLYGLIGALLGILLSDCLVTILGIYWGRAYLSWKEVRLDLPYLLPYLKFGFMFFLSGLLTSAFQHSGTLLVKFFYPDYVQVGYFGLANNIYLTISSAIPHITISFVPLLLALQSQGKTQAVRQWIEQLINMLTIGGMYVVFGILLIGNNLVPLVLGAVYQPVTRNLLPLSVSLWFQILGSVAVLLTIVCNLPRMAVLSAGIRLAALWIIGPFLVARWGSFGGCLSVLIASGCFAGFLTYQMQKTTGFSLRKWASAIALGLLFLPLYWLRSSWPVNLLLYGLFIVGYGLLLFLFGFFKSSDVATLWKIFRSKSKSHDELNRNEYFGA